MRPARLVHALAALLLCSSSAFAQGGAPLELWPGTTYDPKIPTLKQVLGHDHGERITPPEDVERYLRALAAAAPDRTRLTDYARSWQGRPLWLFIVGSRDNMARIDAVKAARRQLANPRLATSDIERLVKDQPVITALMHSVHGNEISGVDAALAEAYHLLAAQGDAHVDLIMRESVVLIDPMQNPDGRARFVASNTHGHAMQADADSLSAEHDEGWPGGRSNHYLFDLNRDWFPQNHPESQGKARYLRQWLPQVTADLHEMGGDSQYYFPPAAAPNTPNTTQAQRDWMMTFGRANAARFDARGFHYFNRETFDSFYPGYGASWPFFIGSLGKTFEMAGSRGLAYRRSDGTMLTYRDGVVRHFTAAIETAATAARNREKLLRDFIDYNRSAVAEGGTTEYVLVAGNDPPRAARLADVLMKNGLDVKRVDAPFAVAGREIAAGSFIVPLAQPMGRLVRTLLDPHTTMGDEFIAEQDRRRKLRLPDQIYDITSWSLPLLYDVDLIVTDKPTGARVSDAGTIPLHDIFNLPPAKLGWLIPWGVGTASAVSELTREGVAVQVAGAPFTLGGRQFGIGTAIVRLSENPREDFLRLEKVDSIRYLELIPIDTTWVDAGASLGANSVRIVKTPRVLLAWDTPTSSLSAGWARFSLERRFNQPVTTMRVGTMARATLSNYDVIVLPSGNYAGALGEPMLGRLREWMRTGGTLITLGEASRWAASAGLLDTYTELRDGRPDRPAPAGGANQDAPRPAPAAAGSAYSYDDAINPPRERPEATSGVIARVNMNMEHWLSSGTDGEVQVMVEGDRVFRPLTLDRGTNVGVYAEESKLVAGGLVWPEVRKQLAQKAFLMHQPVGQGHLIAFAEDPNFRGFTELTQMLLMNAVLFGPIR